MSDIARVQLMLQCNWKPANQYWYEQYQLQLAENARLKQQIKELSEK